MEHIRAKMKLTFGNSLKKYILILDRVTVVSCSYFDIPLNSLIHTIEEAWCIELV